jgi:Mn-dependent DtxR family transcriptional regulator
MNDRKKEAMERYLETILILSRSRPVVRCVDIAEELGVNKSSVSFALKNLREEQYITVTKEKFIYFTDRGREIAETVYERREVLRDWLIGLGVDRQTAAEDASRIKHVVSKESFAAIKNAAMRSDSPCSLS